MPICTPCREAAEGTEAEGPLLSHCPACGRRIQLSSVRWGPEEDDQGFQVCHTKLAYHKHKGRRCDGSGQPHVDRPAWTRHDDCDGCPCQHKPRGSWNQR